MNETAQSKCDCQSCPTKTTKAEIKGMFDAAAQRLEVLAKKASAEATEGAVQRVREGLSEFR